MASVGEVTDAAMRAELSEAEDALDDGHYATSVHHCVTAYARLIDLRPDMIIAPGFTHASAPPQSGAGAPAGGGGLGGVGMGALRPWPSDHGVRFALEQGDRPSLTFAKERFTLSEAATYFEYTLDMVLRAQRRPPPAAPGPMT
jgi:hypothetical protein